MREAILEGQGIELIPLLGGGWKARVGAMEVRGRTAAEVLLRLAEIVLPPETPGVQ